MIKIGHSGVVPFSALLLLLLRSGPAPAVPSVGSAPLAQHFHGYLVVGVLALGVAAQRVALGKARVAELALVGLLARVDPLVALQLARLPETFGADGADKVPLACVDVLVSLWRGEGSVVVKSAQIETKTLFHNINARSKITSEMLPQPIAC